MALEVTLNVGNLLSFFLLGIQPMGEDAEAVIGDSRLAYIKYRYGREHPFCSPAKWHDAAYASDWSGRTQQPDYWVRWRVDAEFLQLMLTLAQEDLNLQKEAIILYLYVREFGEGWWLN